MSTYSLNLRIRFESCSQPVGIWYSENFQQWTWLEKNQVGNCMFKVNNRSTKTRCKVCSKLTLKTPERHPWCCSGVFIVNFEHISHLVLVFYCWLWAGMLTGIVTAFGLTKCLQKQFTIIIIFITIVTDIIISIIKDRANIYVSIIKLNSPFQKLM